MEEIGERSQLFAIIVLSTAGGLRLEGFSAADVREQAVRDVQGRGLLAEAVAVRDPCQRNDFYRASPRGNSVALLGGALSGWKVYGPFLTATDADDFGSEAGEDDDYVVLTRS